MAKHGKELSDDTKKDIIKLIENVYNNTKFFKKNKAYITTHGEHKHAYKC